MRDFTSLPDTFDAQAEALRESRIALLGLGASGRASLAALQEIGVQDVCVIDAQKSAIEQLDDSLEVEVCVASSEEGMRDRVLAWKPDVVIIAPAIPEISLVYRALVQENIPVWSEIELAWRLRKNRQAKWLGVTGTNGKTTTVSMLAHMLSLAHSTDGSLIEEGSSPDPMGKMPIGNIGNVAITEVMHTDYEAYALELSSFQLRSTHTMSLWAAACLNIDDDHLEWHGSFETYAAAKARIYERVQNACIYPIGDSRVQEMVDNADVIEGARAIGVAVGTPSVGQIGLVEQMGIDRAFSQKRFTHGQEIFELDDLSHLAPQGNDLPLHIVKDALMACALALSVGVHAHAVKEALRTFHLGHHRIECVRVLDGVRYIDDSKATNAHAALASIRAQKHNSVVWITGGVAKGAHFNDLVARVAPWLKAVVVIGKDREVWHEALDGYHDAFPIFWTDPESMDPMAEAVKAAHMYARAGDSVLMAPASASFDQFSSYADRGEAFTRSVLSLT